MPIETDLKRAYALLYEEKNPEEALELYDTVLKQSNENLIALIYKAAALEKLYYGYKSWHNEETLNTANNLLSKALVVAESRGDRSKIALVHFRFFVHHFNNGEYLVAEKYLHKSKAFGYNENTLQMWETSLSNKLKNLKKRDENQRYEEIGGADSNVNKQATSTEDKHIEKRGDESKPKPNISFRTEWYQSTQNVSVSIFAQKIPKSVDIVNVEITDGVKLTVTYALPDCGEEFVYSVILAHPVDSNYKLTLLTKKIELSLCKKERIQWKSLEAQESATPAPRPIPQHPKEADSASTLRYPTSSKKEIDWDKLDIGDGEEENDSADAFFQSLYANADPDTKRAMMKSFIESNGTALNTNWEEVSKGKVETSVPEGVDLKEL